MEEYVVVVYLSLRLIEQSYLLLVSQKLFVGKYATGD